MQFVKFRDLIPFAVVFILACAHKAPPIARDRVAPRLKHIAALNNRQVQFTFSEEIDTLSLSPKNFLITADTETLNIISLYPSLSRTEIVAITPLQKMITYNVSGTVYDTAENRGNFTAEFVGSLTPDTIPAWPVKYSRGRGYKEFFVQFSKAMDTTSLRYYIIPEKKLFLKWRNLRTALFSPDSIGDTLCYDTTYYLYIKEAKDISQNRVGALITSITPDTTYEPLILEGKVLLNDTLLKQGLAIIKRNIALGISRVIQGKFRFEVRDSLSYDIIVLYKNYSGKGEVSVGDTNCIILEPGSVNLDSLLH